MLLLVVCWLVAAAALALGLWGVGRWMRERAITGLEARLDAARAEALALEAGLTGLARGDALSLAVEADYLKTVSAKRLREGTLKAAEGKDPYDVLLEEVKSLEERIDTLKAGGDPFAATSGAMLRAYRSRIDGTAQHYSLFVPEHYYGDRDWPVVVRLHGHAWFKPYQGHPARKYAGAITLSPGGRGPTDYKYIGEDDVLEALVDLESRYRVDRGRIYLVGHSMGGTGALNLAVHYPDLWAGALALAGNADDRAWAARWDWDRRPAQAFDDLRDFMRSTTSATTFAENLAHVPVSIVHGTGDETVPVEHARLMVERLRALDSPHNYLELVGHGHGRFPEDFEPVELGRLAARAAVADPRTVRLRCAKLRHGKAYWVRVDRIAGPLLVADVEARIEGPGQVVVRTANALGITLTLAQPIIEQRRPVAVRIDGTKAFSGDLPASGVLHFDRTGGWHATPEPSGARGRVKRLGLEGPVDEALLWPFMVVRGTTSADETERRVVSGAADRFAREWERRFGGTPRIVDDSAVTEADFRRYNLVLFGGAKANAVTARIADRLPIEVTEEGVSLDGKTYKGEAAGAIFVYPNPENAERLVVVYAGSAPESLYQVNGRFGSWFNWGVYDNRKWFDYAAFDSRTNMPETYLVCGFFGPDWTFKGGWKREGLDSERRKVVPARMPAVDWPQGADTVCLSDVLPAEVDQLRGAVGFDRSFRGYSLAAGDEKHERGLGVRAPSSISYDVGGQFSTFKATVGINPEPTDGESETRKHAEELLFEVWGDGEKLAASKVVDWDNTSAEIEAAVGGVERLELRVVPTSGRTWLFGSASWCDARLER
jgi:predicted esterase